MPNLIKKAVITGAIVVAGITGSVIVTNQPDEPVGQDVVLTQSINGIPKNTTLRWNNGKYVPESVPGYGSKADYPDNFWIYDKNIIRGKVKSK